jgi:RND family efflux transporter MFP subunit
VSRAARVLAWCVTAAAAACGDAASRTTDPAALGEPIEPIVLPDDRAGAPAGYVGVVTPRETAEIVAPFTTTVTAIKVDLGAVVKAGDVLAILDPEPGLQELKIARANLKSMRAAVGRAASAKKAAESKLRTEQRALADGVGTQTAVTAAEFAVKEAGGVVGQAQGAADEQRARIEKLEKQVRDAAVVAPIAGKVAQRYAQAGDRVEEGRPVVRVITSDQLFLRFAIPAADAGKLSPGDPIDVRLLPGGKQVTGVVRSIAPELDPVAQHILAEAELEAPPGLLQSGLECRIVPRPRAP